MQLVDKSAIIARKNEDSNELERIKRSLHGKDEEIKNLATIISNLKKNIETQEEKINFLQAQLQ